MKKLKQTDYILNKEKEIGEFKETKISSKNLENKVDKLKKENVQLKKQGVRNINENEKIRKNIEIILEEINRW